MLFHDKKPTSEHALSNQLKMEIESSFGVSGAREMCPSVQVKYYEQKYGSNVVVLRCSREDCRKVKTLFRKHRESGREDVHDASGGRAREVGELEGERFGEDWEVCG